MKRFLAAACIAAALALASCASAPSTAAGNAASSSDAPKVQPLPPDAVVSWADDAWAAFQAEVPKAVQKIAKKQMEKQARERGIALIDMDFYNQVKKEQGR